LEVQLLIEQKTKVFFSYEMLFRKHKTLVFSRQYIFVMLAVPLRLKELPYRGADKSLARPTSRCILFDGENISFDVSLVIYSTNSTNIPPIVINK
jgi:hypothetical protein